MTRAAVYKFHKWIAVAVGGFFLGWLVSGIAMILPTPFPGPARQRTPEALDWRESIVTPGEALSALEKARGSLPPVNAVTLRRIANVAVYQITVAGEGPHLINARSGEPFLITPEFAEEVVRSCFALHSEVAEVVQNELVTGHSVAYPWGPIPAYRIVLSGDYATSYYVSARDGEVRRSDRWSRVQGAISSLHTFEPVKLIVRGERVRKILLFLLSGVGIATAISGYYLALPRRRRSTSGMANMSSDGRDEAVVEASR